MLDSLLAHAKGTTAIFAFQWAMDAGEQGNSSHQAAFADAVARARQVNLDNFGRKRLLLKYGWTLFPTYNISIVRVK